MLAVPSKHRSFRGDVAPADPSANLPNMLREAALAVVGSEISISSQVPAQGALVLAAVVRTSSCPVLPVPIDPHS